MPESLLQVCIVGSILLVSFALAWLSRRPPPPRTRRSSATKLFLTVLALFSLLLPLVAALFFLFPGAGSLWPALSLLVGTLAVSIYLLPLFLRLLLSSAKTLRRTLRNLYGRPDKLSATRTLAHTLARPIFKRKALRTLHRHAWATVALVLTAISITLTNRISSVHSENDSSSWLKIAIDSPQPLPRPAIIHLTGTSGEPLSATIDLQLKPGQSVRFAFSVLSPSGCDNVNLNAPDSVRIGYRTDGPAAWRLVTVQANVQPNSSKPDEPVNASISCKLDITPFAETFAERTFEVDSMNDSYFPPKDHATPTEGHIVDFDIDGASDITLLDDSTSPVALTDTERWLPNQDGRIVVKWHDTRASEQRDVLLVLIGGLLGLAASCLLEWIRPYIAPE